MAGLGYNTEHTDPVSPKLSDDIYYNIFINYIYNLSFQP